MRARELVIAGRIIRDMWQNVRSWWETDIFLLPGKVTYVAAPEGKIVRVPTRVLVEIPSYRIVALGDDAREVEHAGIGKSSVIQPFSARTLYDEQASKVFLRSLFQLVQSSHVSLKPHIIFSTPFDTTPFMQELWQSVLAASGAREITNVHPLLALARGVEIPFQQSHGYALAHIEEDGMSVGVVAFGHVQYEQRVRWDGFPGWEEAQKQFAVLWQKLLALVPPDFSFVLNEEGCICAAEGTPADSSALWSQAVRTPVSFVPLSVLVQGLRWWRKESMRQEYE
jgi:hypothetical protein